MTPGLPELLERRLDTFVGERHLRTSPQRHELTGDGIGACFQAAGLEVREEPVRGPWGWGRNVVGRRPGAAPPEDRRRWILGAHYDTVPGTPGADDNGVAVAGLMELAERTSGLATADSIELVAWDMEEAQGPLAGYALGSREMARTAADPGAEPIAGVLDLEMIGCCRPEPGAQQFPPGFGLLFPGLRRWVADRGDRADFLVVVSDRRSLPIARAVEDAARRTDLPTAVVAVVGAARLVPDLYRSDHAAFWARRLPAVMLTDSADFRNEHYHRPTDTLDTLDFDFAGRVLETCFLALGDLAGAVPSGGTDPPRPTPGANGAPPTR